MTEPGAHILLYDINNNNLIVQHPIEQLFLTLLCSFIILLERENNPGVQFLVSYSETNLQESF